MFLPSRGSAEEFSINSKFHCLGASGLLAHRVSPRIEAMRNSTSLASNRNGARQAVAELADLAEAGDATQDVLLSALTQAPRIRSSWGAWFRGATYRRGLKVLRSESNRRMRERQAARKEGCSDWEAELESTELALVLKSGLAGLDPDTRSLLIEHYWHGSSLTTIADRLGCDLGVVKRRHTQALQLLRQRIGDPSIERRDWSVLPWLAAGLVLATGALLANVGSGQAESSVRSGVEPVAMVDLIPIQPALEPLRESSIPAAKLTPALMFDPTILASAALPSRNR